MKTTAHFTVTPAIAAAEKFLIIRKIVCASLAESNLKI